MLPRAAAEGQQRSFRVITDAGRILGAASWREYPTRTADLQLRVVRTHRRQGVGRRLVTHALREEAARGSRRVEAWLDSTAHPEGVSFFHDLGFTTEDQLTTVEGELHPMLTELTRVVERLRERERIPSDARTVRLADAPTEPVARLYGDFLNRNPGFRADLFAARLEPQRYPASTVVMVNDVVAGFLLAYLEGELTLGPARIVAPGFRSGWVNPLMIHTSLTLSRDAGAKRAQFEFWRDNRDTLRLSERLRARVIRTQSLLSLNLGPELSR